MRALLLLLVAGCSRAQAPTTVDASLPASATVVDAAPKAKENVSYEGTYSSKAGSLFVPDGAEYKSAQWRGDDAGEGLGNGELAFSIDPATGRVEGKGSGALGSVVLAGVRANDGVVSFAIFRADPLDGGFTGAGIGKLSGDSIAGTMRLSRGRADAIREASFTAKAK
jgi:hypothetical protein